jgi:hypothetical protein
MGDLLSGKRGMFDPEYVKKAKGFNLKLQAMLRKILS